ncbi:hypothetical protein OF83DRAFT_55910 [Amylostereum chailletii]|nr:hypothetical protein OF83DRAFT_55910 [Amylostereum chailletii]
MRMTSDTTCSHQLDTKVDKKSRKFAPRRPPPPFFPSEKTFLSVAAVRTAPKTRVDAISGLVSNCFKSYVFSNFALRHAIKVTLQSLVWFADLVQASSFNDKDECQTNIPRMRCRRVIGLST